jgi:FKBP-type peptidyl-prolyl cis-trans isomerase
MFMFSTHPVPRLRAIAMLLLALPLASFAFSPTRPSPIARYAHSTQITPHHKGAAMYMQEPKNDEGSADNTSSSRRSFFASSMTAASAASATAWLMVQSPLPANAGIDPSALKDYSVEGDQSGVQTRLRQIAMDKDRPSDKEDIEYTKLPSGVSFRDFREGKGDATVQSGSKVAVEMTVRCKSFATAKEPGGLKYFATATDTDFHELAFTIGSGQFLPGLEEGMMGMRRGAVRRIEVPSVAVFAAKKSNQLPLPASDNKDGKKRFENLFKTDATLLFEVLVTRIK